MCAIIDANVGHEVFGPNQSEAGQFMLRWLERGGGPLVVGGELLKELGRNVRFVGWLRNAQRMGLARHVPDDDVDAETKTLRSQSICRSNDEHILALARLSGARLLYTNDNALQDDFRDRRIVRGTRGRVYTTARSQNVTGAHRNLLNRTDLCHP